jgi:tetratricopeptide (TPR) repeat protein
VSNYYKNSSKALKEVNAALARGDTRQAELLLRRAIKRYPMSQPLRVCESSLWIDQRKWSQAKESLAAAIKLFPLSAELAHNLAQVRVAEGNLDGAKEILSEIPNEDRAFQTTLDLARLMVATRDFDGARELLRRVKPLNEDQQVGTLFTELMLSVVSKQPLLNGTLETLRSIPQQYRQLEYFVNMSAALIDARSFDHAKDYIDRGLEKFPTNPILHWNKSLTALREGNFEVGWAHFEYRKLLHGYPWDWLKVTRRGIDSRESAELKIIISEQGFGDSIQHLRFICTIKEPKSLKIYVQEKLSKFVQLGFPEHEVLLVEELVLDPATKQSCESLLSLPLLTRANTGDAIRGALIELQSRYASLLYEPKRAAAYKPRIAIAYSSNTKNLKLREKNIKFEQFNRLLISKVNADFCVFQTDFDPEDLSTMVSRGLAPAISEADDFYQTALRLGDVDLVVSVDTALANLTGTLNYPTAVLLPYSEDYRWSQQMANFWFPSVDTFRQGSPGDWSQALENVSQWIRTKYPNS